MGEWNLIDEIVVSCICCKCLLLIQISWLFFEKYVSLSWAQYRYICIPHVNDDMKLILIVAASLLVCRIFLCGFLGYVTTLTKFWAIFAMTTMSVSMRTVAVAADWSLSLCVVWSRWCRGYVRDNANEVRQCETTVWTTDLLSYILHVNIGNTWQCRWQPHFFTYFNILTLSLPIPLRLYTLPYWSNPPFLIFDIWALWYSVLSATVPKCQQLAQLWLADRATAVLWLRPKSSLCSCRQLLYARPRPCTEHVYVTKSAFFEGSASLSPNIPHGRGVAHQPLSV